MKLTASQLRSIVKGTSVITENADGTVYYDITLKEGHKGEKVRALQQKLCTAGFTQEQYVTGTYGEITVKSVKNFQAAMGLPATGIANQETQLRLDKYLSVVQQGNQN